MSIIKVSDDEQPSYYTQHGGFGLQYTRKIHQRHMHEKCMKIIPQYASNQPVHIAINRFYTLWDTETLNSYPRYEYHACVEAK